MRQWISFIVMGSLLSGCAGMRHMFRGGGLQPYYSDNANTVVIEQRHTTGTVAPRYFHEDTVLIYGNGDWVATRVFPYTSPPSKSGIGAGMLRRDQVQHLVDMAFQKPSADEPRFVDLPETVDTHAVGGGQRSIRIFLEDGSHSVSVNGKPPTAFWLFDQAIASATIPLTP